MTLKQAQAIYPDAVLMSLKHKANAFTMDELIKYASTSFCIPIKILYAKVGKTSSRVIYTKVVTNEKQ